MTAFQGTFRDNKRPVITTAPDCLVYLNGQLALPSGGNPGKRVNIQPLITSISCQLGIEQSPGNAQISMHIPKHYIDDFYRAGQLILTTMMEVRIYMKGNFLVGGAPRYYPVFWGLVTSVNQSWSGGTQTVDLSCQDILYWWTIQRINDSASLLGLSQAKQGGMNKGGSGVFTGHNPYDIMYSLSRYAYGDAVNASVGLQGRHARTEPNSAENQRLMHYWTKQWGRISHSLRMYGPNGDVLQGDLLSVALSEKNRQAAGLGKPGKAVRQRAKKYGIYDLGDIDTDAITPFSRNPSRMFSFDLVTSEFQTKKELADTTKQAVGFEFFMDVTGELIFKPPFYNLDVIPNKPVSWVRAIDIINENYAENPPDVTFLEGTANGVKNWQLDFDELVKPKATYVDYRLVQKYGWKPGTFNSEFIGAGLTDNAPRALFYHLVDELDRQNARIHSGSLTIPLRPELRLGYPIYVEPKDSYYYVEGINHQFSYSGQCTTSLTIMARRTKFYASFPYWKTSVGGNEDTANLADPDDIRDNQPPPGQNADPALYPTNLYNRPVDSFSGNPVADANVILTSVLRTDEQKKERGEVNKTSEEQDGETPAEEVARNLVSFRTQFRVYGDNDYVYQIDPKRDNSKSNLSKAPLTSIEVKREKRDGRTVTFAEFPVSDERGYEVIGAYEYGRSVSLSRQGFDFTRQGDQRARELLKISPDVIGGDDVIEDNNPNIDNPLAFNQEANTRKDQVLQTDPNNYGRRLLEIQPTGPETYNNVWGSRGIVKGKNFRAQSTRISGEAGDAVGTLDVGQSNRPFRPIDQVAKWKANGTLAAARRRAGVSESQYPDDVLLAFIHTESAGKPNARRTNSNGKLSQFCGLVQIGHANAADVEDENGNPQENTDFLGTGPDDEAAATRSLVHFIRYQEKYKSRHNYEPDKMAIVWKGGPGTAKRFNQLQNGGSTGSELKGFLNKRWGTDQYVAHIQEARGVWGGVNVETDTVVATEEEREAVNELGTPPVIDPEVSARTSNNLFASALEDNEQEGVLPSNVNPIRDPGLIPHINDFLRNIYKEAFQSEGEIERELRGETRNRARAADQASRRTANPSPQRDLVDSPLSRSEVQSALEEGQTPSEVFGTDGRWAQVKEDVARVRQQVQQTEDAASNIDLEDFDPIIGDDEGES